MGHFIMVGVGRVGIGLAVGWAIAGLRRHLSDPFLLCPSAPPFVSAMNQRALIPLFTLMMEAVVPLALSEARNTAMSANSCMVGRLRSIDIDTSMSLAA